MTNKQLDEEEGLVDHKPRMAALLAVHLVSQVLEEAYVIANAAKDSGEPWKYIQMLKNLKNSESSFADDEDESLGASKGDTIKENNIEMVANVATSTPEKHAARQIGCSDSEEISAFIDATLIGQGDEEISINTTLIGQGDEEISQQNDLNNSTSMFINHLFDMSDVERALVCDDTDITQSTSAPNDLLGEAMNKIMDSYVASSFLPVVDFPIVVEQDFKDDVPVIDMLSRNDESEYSLLDDAYAADIRRDVAFYIDEDPSLKNDNFESLTTATVEDIIEEVVNETEINQNKDFQLYENAYMTLNRDDDQCSEDDGFPILQDPKEMTLQEVALMTANSSEDEVHYAEASVSKTKDDEATVSGTNASRRSTLAHRCRVQGARLLSCLRGWWRRKTPGKRKESRRSGLGAVCPLSPDARRRATSLLDQRLLRSPSPSRPVLWKFNTVNEALVNSNRWKDYSFDAMAEGSGDL